MTAGRTRRNLLLLAALTLGPVGCFNSHNPGYFPYYLPGGRITQEHAKPRFGYFRDFDPKAHRLEVTPANATAPLGSQIVLVATVYDKDGEPRRSRRVEWMLEGPGNIVEVDEAGFYSGRGYKVDNKYAVGYTNYVTHTITRGNDDPKDDVTICPGQTFCVVSSAVPGETTITAYAPGVFNWDNGRKVVKVAWGEGRFSFPPPAVVRSGGETTLVTTVTKFDGDGPVPPAYRVRYKLLDGDESPPAVLVARGGSGTTGVMTGTTAREAEAAVDANGSAAVRLVQPTAKPGKSRVVVEVVKPAENGVGPGTVVSRRETVIEWAAPQVQLNVTTPPGAGLNGTFPATVTLTNTGPIESREVRVRVGLSDRATMASSEPPPNRQDAEGLIFDLPSIPPGQKQSVVLQVKPAGVGPVTVTAEAVTADGLRAESRSGTKVEQGKLTVLVEAPPQGIAGERVPVKVAVTNPGPSPAANVTVWARFDDALKHASGKNPVELAAGTVAPGATKTLELPLTAKTPGRYAVRATVTADGGISGAAEPVTFDVRRAELKAAVAGPRLVYLNQEFAWTVAVGNPGDSVISNVLVRATLPPECKLTDAGEAKAGAGSVEWKLAELRPGDQKTLTLKLVPTKLTDRAAIAVSALGDALAPSRTEPGKTVGDPVEARGEASVAVVGVPAVALELATPSGVIEAGKRAVFKVRVKNQGTVSARDIEVAAFTTAELRMHAGSGATAGRVDSDGKVVFGRLEELRPGETATFTVEVDAASPGDARFRAEVRAAHLAGPLKEEQSARVVGK